MVTSNLVEMQMHLDALENMIRTRGGIETLGMDGVLQMSIKWFFSQHRTLLLRYRC